MKVRFNFDWRITLICAVMTTGTIFLSFWQKSRHHEKLQIIADFTERLEAPALQQPTFLKQLKEQPAELPYRMLDLRGRYDYQNQILIDNRRLDNAAGRYLMTPLLLDNNQAVLVNRGFIPKIFSSKTELAQFDQSKETVSITGIIKTGKSRGSFMQPADPRPDPKNPALIWLRVDPANIARQLPYDLLPLYVELTESDQKLLPADLIKQDSDKTDILVMPGAEKRVGTSGIVAGVKYPVPSPDRVLSAGRHLGYVYEWLFIGLLIGAIGLVSQLKRNEPGDDFSRNK